MQHTVTVTAQSAASGQRQHTVSTSTATLKHQLNSIRFVSNTMNIQHTETLLANKQTKYLYNNQSVNDTNENDNTTAHYKCN